MTTYGCLGDSYKWYHEEGLEEYLKSLATGRYGSDFRSVIFEEILQIK